jgi:hypothetical protein
MCHFHLNPSVRKKFTWWLLNMLAIWLFLKCSRPNSPKKCFYTIYFGAKVVSDYFPSLQVLQQASPRSVWAIGANLNLLFCLTKAPDKNLRV